MAYLYVNSDRSRLSISLAPNLAIDSNPSGLIHALAWKGAPLKTSFWNQPDTLGKGNRARDPPNHKWPRSALLHCQARDYPSHLPNTKASGKNWQEGPITTYDSTGEPLWPHVPCPEKSWSWGGGIFKGILPQQVPKAPPLPPLARDSFSPLGQLSKSGMK